MNTTLELAYADGVRDLSDATAKLNAGRCLGYIVVGWELRIIGIPHEHYRLSKGIEWQDIQGEGCFSVLGFIDGRPLVVRNKSGERHWPPGLGGEARRIIHETFDHLVTRNEPVGLEK